MKKKNILLMILSLVFVSNATKLFCAGIIKELIKPKTDKAEIIVFGTESKARQQLSNLKNEKQKLEDETKEFTDQINKRISETTSQIQEATLQLKKEPEYADFINNKLSLNNETYQALKDIQLYRKQLIDSFDEHIKLLEEYLKDPEFPEYIKEYRIQKRFYTINELLNLHEMILGQEKRTYSLEKQLKNANIELENREQSASATSKEYEKKKKELDAFVKKPEDTPTPTDMFAFNTQQKLELLTLQENLLKTRKELENYRLKETSDKVSLIDTKIFIAKIKLTLLKKAAKDIKPFIKISESDIATDKAKLDNKIKETTIKDVQFNREIENTTKSKDAKSKQLEQFSKKFDVPINIELDKWSVDPTTEKEYINIFQIGVANEYISFLKRKKEFIETQKSKNADQLSQSKLQINVTETFYKITNKKFTSEEEITREISKYSTLKADINAKIARFNERKNAASDQLDIKRKALEKIKELKNQLQRDKNKIFRNIANYTNCTNYLQNAEELIKEQIKLLKSIIGSYETIIETNKGSAKRVDFIVSELEDTLWGYRPEYAVKLQDLKNIIPEFVRFTNTLKSYFIQFSFVNLLEKIKLAFPTSFDFIIFIIKMIILALLLLLLRVYTPIINQKLIRTAKEHSGLRFLSLFAAFILEFIVKYFLLIFIWIISFTVIRLNAIPDDLVKILFFLISIPYLLYIANRLIAYFKSFNIRCDYALIGKTLQGRLISAFAIILYSTIIIFLFRQAFIISMIYKSELPFILVVMHIIIIQIALLAVLPLIVKELIFNIIPTTTKTWRAVHAQVNRFYYLIWVIIGVIIILSNPYIALSRQVWYIVSRVLITIVLIKLLFMLQNLIKKISLALFFKTEGDMVQERFNWGKTGYGLFLILTFILLISIGILIGASIWGWKISATSVYENWLNWEIGRSPDGQAVTFISLIKISIYVALGFVAASLINKFVLRKIFDLLLVEAGVQNAATSILKYVIVTTFIVIGFYSHGLGEVVKWVLITLTFSIGWIFKDPIADFAYYFIILIQRPFKIGDYIQVKEDDVFGVVRKITPRSVIVRFRNSETILVPNSKAISKPIANWNYTPGFVAFNDIKLIISFNSDPKMVKELILEAITSHPNILKSPKPVVRLNNFSEYGYEFLIRGFVSSHYTLDMWDIASDVRFNIAKILKENNIKIAVPLRMMVTEQTIKKEKKEESPKKESE